MVAPWRCASPAAAWNEIQGDRGELGPNQQGRILEQEVGAKTEEKAFFSHRQSSPERAVL